MKAVRKGTREGWLAPPHGPVVPHTRGAASWAIAGAPGDASLTVAPNGQILAVTPKLRATLEYGSGILEGRPVAEIVSKADCRTVRELLEGATRRQGIVVHRCFRLVSASGAELWVGCAARSMPEADRRPEVLLFLRHLPEATEEEARHLEHQAGLQALALELAMAEERERRRIALGLHDGVGQSLALARMKLGACRAGAEGRQERAVREVEDLIDEAIRATRELTFDLASPLLYELGLEEAILSEGERLVTSQGLDFSFSSEGRPEPSAADPIALLHRALREVLLNAVKHARATRISVVLSARPDHLEIRVTDDGVGFDASRDEARHGPPTGLGLPSQQEQLRAIGGELTVGSTPGGGSRCVLRVPRGIVGP